jgi:hypothetical protein
MPHFHFHIREDGRLIRDDEGQELDDVDIARKEAIATGASIARDAFIAGSARRIVVDVHENDRPFLKVSVTLDVEE